MFSEKTITASTHVREERSLALSLSLCIGRSGPLPSSRTLESELTPTTKRVP
nr:hypothetical protein [uncultured bacterium]